MLEPFLLVSNEDMAIRSSGSCITPRNKLYLTLRFLAGASYLDLMFSYQVSKSALFTTDLKKGTIWPVILAINSLPELFIHLPVENPVKMEELAADFAYYTNGAMFGCVSAVNGWVCVTRKPFGKEVPNPMIYRNRHNCWGLVVMAGCDAHCRFNIFSCMNPGSTNDALAWSWCPQKDIVEGNDWPKDSYVIGDEAFVCTNNFLVPYAGTRIGVESDSFNYYLSKMRQCIERAFGMLVTRWGILWRPLKTRHMSWTAILGALGRLHNFCIDCNDIPVRERARRDHEDGDEMEVILNDEFAEESLRAERLQRRNKFKVELHRKGMIRPSTNNNSRA
jgi:hypothetical protein